VDQFEFGVKFKKLDIVNSTIQTTIKVAGFVVVAWILSASLRILAGKQTILNVAMQVVASLGLSAKISYALGITGVVYGLRQRHLRRLTIEKMSGHQRKLEQALDQKRTSSEITLKGTTRPDDKSLE
jgi:hypothetical protein